MKDKTNGEQFMNKWLKQMNYPYVSISLRQNTSNAKTTVSFSQERFLIIKLRNEFQTEYTSPYALVVFLIATFFFPLLLIA